jgi:hypothetical protein
VTRRDSERRCSAWNNWSVASALSWRSRSSKCSRLQRVVRQRRSCHRPVKTVWPVFALIKRQLTLVPSLARHQQQVVVVAAPHFKGDPFSVRGPARKTCGPRCQTPSHVFQLPSQPRTRHLPVAFHRGV